MTFAAQLDAQERECMAEGGMDSEDFIKFAAADSTNVAVDGNFSVQVIEKALEGTPIFKDTDLFHVCPLQFLICN